MSDEYDYERQLRRIIPSLSWQACTGKEQCPVVRGAKGYKAGIVVPSDYENLGGVSFGVAVFKYVAKKKHGRRKSHVIVLSGGPGRSHYEEVDEVEMLMTSLHSTVYLINHRGMGESGEFVSSDTKTLDIKKNVGSIVKNGLFPVKDLTVRNAALDVGMLALGIRHNDGYGQGQPMGISGNSYGSTWGLQVIRLLPTLFDFAILTNVPRQRGFSPDTWRGIAENCALDDYCREKIGGRVYGEFLRGIGRIMNVTTNKCTEAFVRRVFAPAFEKLPYHERLEELSSLFWSLGDRGPNMPETPKNLRMTQLVIPFVKATSDCVDSSVYVNEVLEPLSPFVDARNRNLSVQEGEKGFNEWVNMIVSLDSLEFDFSEDCTEEFLKKAVDPHRNYVLCNVYQEWFRKLQPYLGGMKFSNTMPPSTTKTRILFSMGRMDENTTYGPARALFGAIKAPEKIWFMLDHRDHQSMWSKPYYKLLQYVVGITKSISEKEIRQAIEKINNKERLDWRFAGTEWEKLWKHMKKGPKTIPLRQQLSSAPSLEIVQSGQASEAVSYKPKKPIPGQKVAEHRGTCVPYRLIPGIKAPSRSAGKRSGLANVQRSSRRGLGTKNNRNTKSGKNRGLANVRRSLRLGLATKSNRSAKGVQMPFRKGVQIPSRLAMLTRSRKKAMSGAARALPEAAVSEYLQALSRSEKAFTPLLAKSDAINMMADVQASCGLAVAPKTAMLTRSKEKIMSCNSTLALMLIMMKKIG